jgi:hypothetical protein
MQILPALRAEALALACALTPAAHAADTTGLLTGTPRLACEATLCLSSSLRPGECSPSLEHYFGIKRHGLPCSSHWRICCASLVRSRDISITPFMW